HLSSPRAQQRVRACGVVLSAGLRSGSFDSSPVSSPWAQSCGLGNHSSVTRGLPSVRRKLGPTAVLTRHFLPYGEQTRSPASQPAQPAPSHARWSRVREEWGRLL